MASSETGGRRRRGRRYWRNLLIVAVVGVIPVFSIIAAIQGVRGVDKFAHPARLPLSGQTPKDAGMDYEDVSFLTEDGLTLRGWYLPSTNGAAVMVLHGFGNNRESVFSVAHMLNKHGYGALLFDERAQGASDGAQLSTAWLDGLAAVDYLLGRDDAQRIGAWGFSLGGLVVIQAAALRPELEAVAADGAGPAGYQDIPRQTFLDWLYIPYDLAFYPAFQAQAGGLGAMSTKEAVARINPRPVFLISAAGERFDQSLEQRMTQGFYDAAREPKSLWQVPGVGHGEAFIVYPDEYERRLIEFFDRALLS